LSGFGPLVSISANYLGKARWRVPVAIITLAINVTLDLILVPKIGVIGGAVGTDAAYALYAPAHLFICQRALQLDLRPALWTLLRATLAGGAMTGVILLFGDSLSEAWKIPLGGLTGLFVFCLVLWLTREVSVAEVRVVLGRLPLVQRRVR